MTVTDYREIVAALRDVPGVTEADVEPDDDGGMGMLRLGLVPGVDEVEVATTVGRLLRERFGIGVDAERVQIVEEADLSEPVEVPVGLVPSPRTADRPAIHRMHLVSSGLDVTASVTLTSNGRSAVGGSRGNASQVGVHRAVANATLRAVEELLDSVARFELDHLEVTQLGAERTVLVGLSMLSSRGSERLTGAAGVREDVRQAVIRATLDALNRRFETLLA